MLYNYTYKKDYGQEDKITVERPVFSKVNNVTGLSCEKQLLQINK